MSGATLGTAMDRPSNPRQNANEPYLDLAMRRVRLLLHRRILWLRKAWKQDPLQSYRGLVISEEQADALLADRGWSAEARFYRQDPEAVAIGRLLGDVEAELQRQQTSATGDRALPAPETIGRLFGLTPFERDVLLLCVALELDPAFERLFAYVQDDVTRKYATPHLAVALLAGPSAESGDRVSSRDVVDRGRREALRAAHASFQPDAPLRRFCLVNVDAAPTPTGGLLCPLQLDSRVVDYLRGVNRVDERVADVIQPVATAPLAPSHDEIVDDVVRVLARSAGGPRPPVNLVGARGAGKHVVAGAIADRLGLGCYVFDPSKVSAQAGERPSVRRLLEREVMLLQAALYIDGTGHDRRDAVTTAVVTGLVEGLAPFFMLGSEEPWHTDNEMLAIAVRKPDAREQRALWERMLGGTFGADGARLDQLVQQFDLGPTAIAQAVTRVRRGVSRGGERELTVDRLWDACRELTRRSLVDLGARLTSAHTWDDIVLPSDVLAQLREIADQVAHRFTVYETWGFGTRLTRGAGVTALFAGPSGTGKTMAAEVLANHLKLALYRIDLAGVVNKYIGETEKNLRRVFDAAEEGGVILFFDEADALFGKRTEVKDSHDRYANIEIDYLLQRMETYRGLAILATNRKTSLDRAFLRRLRFLVDFPIPDPRSRRAIWQKVFPASAPARNLDFDALSALEITGGNIRNVAVNGAFLAASAGADISMTHLVRAARREYTKIDKLATATEFGRYDERAGA